MHIEEQFSYLKQLSNPWKSLLVLLPALILASLLLTQVLDEYNTPVDNTIQLRDAIISSERTAYKLLNAFDSAENVDKLNALTNQQYLVDAQLSVLDPAADEINEVDSAVYTQLIPIIDGWDQLREDLLDIKDRQELSERIVNQAYTIRTLAERLKNNGSELTNLMVSKNLEPVKIEFAAKQQILLERITALLPSESLSNNQMSSIVKLLGVDVAQLGKLNNALLIGDSSANLARVRDSASREMLIAMGREFRRMAVATERMIVNSPTIKFIEDVRQDSQRTLKTMISRHPPLIEALLPLPTQQTTRSTLTTALAICTLLMLLFAILVIVYGKRKLHQGIKFAADNQIDQFRELTLTSENALHDLNVLLAEIQWMAISDLRDEPALSQVMSLGPAAQKSLIQLHRRWRSFSETVNLLEDSSSGLNDHLQQLQYLIQEQCHRTELVNKHTHLSITSLAKQQQPTMALGGQSMMIEKSGRALLQLAEQNLMSLQEMSESLDETNDQSLLFKQASDLLERLQTQISDILNQQSYGYDNGIQNNYGVNQYAQLDDLVQTKIEFQNTLAQLNGHVNNVGHNMNRIAHGTRQTIRIVEKMGNASNDLQDSSNYIKDSFKMQVHRSKQSYGSMKQLHQLAARINVQFSSVQSVHAELSHSLSQIVSGASNTYNTVHPMIDQDNLPTLGIPVDADFEEEFDDEFESKLKRR